MSDWEPAALRAFERAGEIDIAAYRPDGTLRTPRIVWHVVVDGSLYLRSVRGEEGAWDRGVLRTGIGQIRWGGATAQVTFVADHSQDGAIDRAYRAKYGGGSPVVAITSPTASATTLRVEPR